MTLAILVLSHIWQIPDFKEAILTEDEKRSFVLIEQDI